MEVSVVMYLGWCGVLIDELNVSEESGISARSAEGNELNTKAMIGFDSDRVCHRSVWENAAFLDEVSYLYRPCPLLAPYE